MKPKMYLFPTLDSLTTPFVRLEDYQSLEKEAKYLKDYCDQLVELGNLPCLPKDLENLREANTSFVMENEKLHNLLYAAGICADCHSEIQHFVDEPFASCPCGTGEDCSGPSTIQKLRMDNSELLGLCADLNIENKDLVQQLDEFVAGVKKRDEKIEALKEQINFLTDVNCVLLDQEVHDERIQGWKNKWECAVEMAAIAENKLADAEKNVRYWQNSFNGMSDKAIEAAIKLDKISEII